MTSMEALNIQEEVIAVERKISPLAYKQAFVSSVSPFIDSQFLTEEEKRRLHFERCEKEYHARMKPTHLGQIYSYQNARPQLANRKRLDMMDQGSPHHPR